MKLLLILFLLFCNSLVSAQNTFRALIKDKETNEPLTGATALLKGTNNGGSANENGAISIENIPNGRQVFIFSYVGYEQQIHAFTFPLSDTMPVEILLRSAEEELEEVIVTATRTSRSIDDIPTRIEAVSGEEVDEKANMKPGDIRMLLNESTGIQTQQTSATSYNSSIRIQGLDGKYTQMLRDGYPLYSGYSGGLGLLQVAPLDLKQVEIIKGASSTLYGGGAIAGLVNLVSKTPEEVRKLDFLVNATSALGLDVSGFYAQKFERTGTTIFVSYNKGTPYDPAGIGLTAIPEYDRITLNPRLFLYFSRRTTVDIGLFATAEKRTGGDIRYIKGRGDNTHSYFEENNTARMSAQFGMTHYFTDSSILKIKGSAGYFNRSIDLPDYTFSGNQISSFTEITFEKKQDKLDWIAGLNLWTEKFEQDNRVASEVVDYAHNTYGLFAQNTWNISGFFAMETGIRADYQEQYGFFLLPRISAMFRFNSKLTARLGGGMGYKIPTVFTEDAERVQFRNVLPINASETESERSYGANLDFNYRTVIGDHMTLSINTLVFYTKILKPLILTPVSGGFLEFKQPGGFLDTKGLEANVKITYRDFKLFFGYTLADVSQNINGETFAYPLVAKNRLNNVLIYEVEEKLKIGLEAYYFSKQKLNDGSMGRSYWICGLMAEKIWEHISVFVNFENLLDTRQTRFDVIYDGPVTDPVFRDIYAPVDGFVVNGGVKIRL